jgi:hypothetical protein
MSEVVIHETSGVVLCMMRLVIARKLHSQLVDGMAAAAAAESHMRTTGEEEVGTSAVSHNHGDLVSEEGKSRTSEGMAVSVQEAQGALVVPGVQGDFHTQ